MMSARVVGHSDRRHVRCDGDCMAAAPARRPGGVPGVDGPARGGDGLLVEEVEKILHAEGGGYFQT